MEIGATGAPLPPSPLWLPPMALRSLFARCTFLIRMLRRSKESWTKGGHLQLAPLHRPTPFADNWRPSQNRTVSDVPPSCSASFQFDGSRNPTPSFGGARLGRVLPGIRGPDPPHAEASGGPPPL